MSRCFGVRLSAIRFATWVVAAWCGFLLPGFGADGYAAKNRQRKGPNAPNKEKLRSAESDRLVMTLKTGIPNGCTWKSRKRKKTLEGLGKKFARIPTVRDVESGASLVAAARQIVDIHKQEKDVLHAYANTILAELGRGPVKIEDMLSRHADSIKKEAADGMPAETTAVMTSGMAPVAPQSEIELKIVALGQVSEGLYDADFHSGVAAAFVRDMGPTDKRLSSLRRNIKQWSVRADQVSRQHPINPDHVEELSADAERFLDEGTDLLRRVPNRVLTKPSITPFIDVDIPKNELPQYTETAPHPGSEVVRQMIEKACSAHRALLQQSILSLKGRVQSLREWAGLTNRQFIMHGARVEERMKGSEVVPLLGRRLRDFEQVEGATNQGRYHYQSPLVYAQRLMAHMIHEVGKKQPEDAAKITVRAKELSHSTRSMFNDELTMAEILHDPAKIIWALGLDRDKLLHTPNKEPYYNINIDLYSPLHELLAWRGLEILEILSRGQPNQKDLRWAFSLTDGQNLGKLSKTPRVWNIHELLANQVRGVSEPHQFWRKFWGDPPLKDDGRIVANAAQVATLQLLVEQSLLSLPKHEQPALFQDLGLKGRKWAKGPGIKVSDILGLVEPSAGTLEAAVTLEKQNQQQAIDPAALQLLKQGRRFERAMAEMVEAAITSPEPYPWLAPFLSNSKDVGVRVVFSEHEGRMLLTHSSSTEAPTTTN